MRSKHLILAGSGLLVLSAFLITRPTGPDARSAAVAHTSAEPTTRPTTNPSAAKPHNVELPAGQSSRRERTGASEAASPIGVPTREPQTAETRSSTETQVHPQLSTTGQPAAQAGTEVDVPDSATPAPAIQLSEKVKLPAVILALNAAQRDPDKKISQPIAAAMHAIVDTFYQDLAESVRKPSSHDPVVVRGETAVSDTILIEPGEAVDRARDRANDTYRVLFGDAAYNQMTMSALLESQIPPEASR